MDILGLPVVMIENIFSYLTYDEIAKNRLVCRPFNEICSKMLNRGFLLIEKRHGVALKTVKAQLPRRESERRYHPLSRHCDILSSIETRISMLNMTYAKFIDSGICCFIPGRVIDEIKRVLRLVEATTTPPRAHEVLQELRDISSMAIEHFDDKISPALKQRLREHLPAPHNPAQPANALGPAAMKQEMLNIKRRSVLNARLSLHLASQYKKFYKRMVSYRRVALAQRRTIKDLTQKHIEQDAAIADLKKRIEECDIKYSELTHTNQAVGASSSTGTPSSTAPRHFASQINLDLSHLPIGTGIRIQGKYLPKLIGLNDPAACTCRVQNMKPRKPIIRLPSISETQEANNEPRGRFDGEPSTSQDEPSTAQSSMDKVNTITKELRFLTKSEFNMRYGKRSKSMSDSNERKKMKYD